MRIAAVDIGTNTALLLIGEKTGGNIAILRDEHAVARLGEGVDEHRNISDTALARAADILSFYRQLCAQYGVDHVVAVTTSAVRDAGNHDRVLAVMSEALGAPVGVITGEEEARLSFLGSAEGRELCTIIDIGGGSTEYITGHNGAIIQRTSLNIGAVRLSERHFSSLPPAQDEVAQARGEVRRHLSSLPAVERGEITGVGGTFTTLAAIDLRLVEFDAAAVHRHVLASDTVAALTRRLLSSTLDELIADRAIHPKRADILPMGALILDESLKHFGVKYCRASTRGLRYGVLVDALSKL